MATDDRDRPQTHAAQALGWDEPQFRSVVPPIFPSASYLRADDGSYPGGHTYTRDQNPTYDQPEALLSRIEGGAAARLFSSGMAAATTVFETLQSGDHVVAPAEMYWTIRLWLEKLPQTKGVTVSFADNEDLDSWQANLQKPNTKLVWLETPANPSMQITDVRKVCEMAHAVGAYVVADSTVATPVLTRPLALGCDLVMHSATKQLNGHTDVLAGALITKVEDERWHRILMDRGYRGAMLGPFEAWLLMRGMRTLYLRVRASCEGAQRVAEALFARSDVHQVLYPGLPSHPGHALAKQQMDGGFGALLSFRVNGGAERARAVAARLRLFKNGTSLGAVESLVEHRAPIEGQGTRVPDDLLRLSIGIEHPDDLVADLEQALKE
ncbi:MAG: aminotransferase class I/II-fold pyridoxal phosphate-dependent enzyme [Myxococcota bacterium]